jgi:antirestriction protein
MINLYIANLGAYNRGHLIGAWVTLPMDEDELREKIKSILAEGDEQAIKCKEYYGPDEEVAIHDWECEIDGVEIGEYSNIFNLNELAERLDDLKDYQLKDLEAIAAATSNDIDECLDILEDGRYSIISDVDSEEDLGYAVVEEGHFSCNVPEELKNYLDYEAIGREWSMTYTIISSLKVAVEVF